MTNSDQNSFLRPVWLAKRVYSSWVTMLGTFANQRGLLIVLLGEMNGQHCQPWTALWPSEGRLRMSIAVSRLVRAIQELINSSGGLEILCTAYKDCSRSFHMVRMR